MIWNIGIFFWRYNFNWYHNIANLIFVCLSLNLHLYINIYFFPVLKVSHDMNYRLLCFWRYNISLISWNWQSHIWSSLSQFSFSYIKKYKKSFSLFWMYLMIWNIVFFFWRYNISLISWNCQSQIRSSLPLFSFVYISLILNLIYLMQWNIVFFFCEYNISLIS